MRTLRLGAEYAVQHVAPDCLNREGIARNAESQWSNHFTLRAMALLEGVDIVSINEGAMNSNGLSDRVILLPGELHRPGRPGRYLLHGYKSWALDIVPRLLRQRAGTSAADERPVRVIVPTTDQTLRRDAAHCQKTCHATWLVTWGPACKCVAWACNLVARLATWHATMRMRKDSQQRHHRIRSMSAHHQWREHAGA